ncbi:GGDEF domain-containing protein [Desulfopila sp. IMCC35006]|uniref:GGDEF domain-containing protein n=1 Tax=Desulfopila sp. IMCC35006 TaxID=2569542 RepID=UPI0010AD8AAD|nr:GGDEF domain-containing protein [Desulfopila sp. IMCC35006]TKB25141.1 GGDEF domain-containing protein [Desulfopila sp. IMCC35006]
MDKLKSDYLTHYSGKILNGGYSAKLCRRLTECLTHLVALDQMCLPIIPYIAAWHGDEKIIWYEHVGKRLLAILDCQPSEVVEVFRKSIVDRRAYRYVGHEEATIEEEIVTRDELRGDQCGLREEVKEEGAVECIYQIALAEKKTIWLKDQATIEIFGDDEICLSLGYLTDVTKEMEQKNLMEKFGYFDDLTKLPKRSIMQRIIEVNIGNFHRGHINDFVFLLLDIDHFKEVNDTYGHLAGDQVLVNLAEVMSGTKRQEDEIGRYGGEEFYAFTVGSLENGLQFAERLRLAVASTDFVYNQQRIPLTVSIGLVVASQLATTGKITVEELVGVADRRLYVAKQGGRNRVVSE